MTRLVLKGLAGRYPGAAAAAVEPTDLAVESGELVALLGPSGCGKTTVLRMIAGLLAPDAGDILFDGQSVLALPPERRGAVMVFQNHLVFPSMTVAQNVGFGLRMAGLPRAEIAMRVAAMLTKVQLTALADRRPADLSGGQAQRVALARALILNPKVLLLDEPLSSLDAGLRSEMGALIRGLQRESGVTTIFVTHDQEEAVALADRIGLMRAGRLVQIGPPEVFYSRPADLWTARFFGGMNAVAGKVTGSRFDGPLGPLVLPDGVRQGPSVLTIRPEALRRSMETGGENRVEGQVRQCRFLGTRTRVDIEVEGQGLTVDLAPDEARDLRPGDRIGLTLPREALWVLPPDPGA